MSVNKKIAPWVLLCADFNECRNILYLGTSAHEKSFYDQEVLNGVEFKRNIIRYSKNQSDSLDVDFSSLQHDSSTLPFRSNRFDLIVFCDNPAGKAVSVFRFFAEIYRILAPGGCLFFCFRNSCNYHRLQSILQPSRHYEQDPPIMLHASVPYCRSLLRSAGFSRADFYSFSPDCAHVSMIRRCRNKTIASSLYPVVSRTNISHYIKASLKNTRLFRNYFDCYYGVVAFKNADNRNDVTSKIEKIVNHKYKSSSWRVWGDTFHVTRKGTFVFSLYDNTSNKKAVSKIPLNRNTAIHLKSNYYALTAIHDSKEIDLNVKKITPKAIVRSGHLDKFMYFVEELKEGSPAVMYCRDKDRYSEILYASSVLVSALHKTSYVLKPNEYDKMIKEKVINFSKITKLESQFVSKMHDYLSKSIGDMDMLVFNKGDCSSNNFIIDRHNNVTGIIDWDQFRENYFPLIDIVNIIESFRRNSDNKSMGDIIINVFFRNNLNELETSILDRYCEFLDIKVPELMPFVLLYWMDHILAQNAESVMRDKRWVKNNIIQVVHDLNKNFF